jgi:hypothetical protein
MILISNLAQARPGLSFLKVRLVGSASNKSGIGARVTVVVGENHYTQVLDGKSGYLSQSLTPLYFGLRAAESIDEVQVTWPSGVVQTQSRPPINKILVMSEPVAD